MTKSTPPVSDGDLAGAEWRSSSFGDQAGDRVEVAKLDDGRTAMRNGRHPEQGVVVFTAAEIDAWIKGCKAGEFDDIR